jgi:dihydrolipoamide dehydrogenase
VIGAGTAGLAAERHARAAGARTLLIDPAFAGTTCATVGCMPSKLLIAAADVAHTLGRAGRFGIEARGRPDGRRVMARLRKERDRFVAGVKKSFRALPAGVRIEATARFAAPGRLLLDDGRSVAARAIVIATGAAPVVPKPFRGLGDRLLTNETLFEMADLPASLGVIGAGPLGLEMAQALARLGVEVTVFDQARALAGLPEGELSERLRRALAGEFALHLGVEVRARAEPGFVLLEWSGSGSGTHRVERLLVAAGRAPRLDGLALDAAGLRLDRAGVPVFDPGTLQCGDAPVFIAGDANDRRPVLHEATAEGTIAGRNAAAWPDLGHAGRMVPLALAFTRPEAATVGEVPDMADGAHVSADASYDDQGRARVEAREGGLVRLFATSDGGRLVAAQIAAPGGGHLAHLLAWAIAARMTAAEVLARPFYHPTLEEGLQPALRALCAAARSPAPWDRDDRPPPGA